MASVAPAARRDSEPPSRDTGLALVASAALLGALGLVLAGRRRRAQPVLRPALAATTLLAFCLGLVAPARSLPTGDVNADGRLDAADALLMRQISQGARTPGADELERADIAPLDQTPETSEPRVHPGDEALLWRALHGDDVDGDGIAANDELALGASPFRIDSDRDGVADDVELGDQSALDDADTDGDGFSDAEEKAAGTDPRKGVVYRHGDQLGSTVLVTRATGTGPALVVERAVYLPFGGRVAASAGGSTKAPAFGFTGQRYDHASNVYDYGARFYDPALGRFLQPDSIVPNAYASQSLNRYSYVENNPLGRIDPSGNWSLDFGLGIGTLSFSDAAWIDFTFGPALGVGLTSGTYGDGYGFNFMADRGGLDVGIFAADSFLRLGMSSRGAYAVSNGWSAGNAPPADHLGREFVLRDYSVREGLYELPKAGGDPWGVAYNASLSDARATTSYQKATVEVGPWAMAGRTEDLAFTIGHEFAHVRDISPEGWQEFLNELTNRRGVESISGRELGEHILELRAYHGDRERSRQYGASWSAARNSQIYYGRHRIALETASPGLADEALRWR
jgi:RHS repeat-associated protein